MREEKHSLKDYENEFEKIGFIWDLEVFFCQPEYSGGLQEYLPKNIFYPITFAYSIKNLILYDQNIKKYSWSEINEDYKYLRDISKSINLRNVFLENELRPLHLSYYNKELTIKNLFFTKKMKIIFEKLVYAYKNNLMILNKDLITFISKALKYYNKLNNPFEFFSLDKYELDKSSSLEEDYLKQTYYQFFLDIEKDFNNLLYGDIIDNNILNRKNKDSKCIKDNFIIQLYEKTFIRGEYFKYDNCCDAFVEYLELIINSEYFTSVDLIDDYIKLETHINHYLSNNTLKEDEYESLVCNINSINKKIKAIHENQVYYNKLSNLLTLNIEAICKGWNTFEIIEVELNKDILTDYNSNKLEKRMLLLNKTFWKLYRDFLYFGLLTNENILDSKYLNENEQFINDSYDLFKSTKEEFEE